MIHCAINSECLFPTAGQESTTIITQENVYLLASLESDVRRGDTFISEVSMLANRAFISYFLKLVLNFSSIICITGSMKNMSRDKVYK